MHPNQQFIPLLPYPVSGLDKLHSLTLACPVYRPPSPSPATVCTRTWPPLWDLLSPVTRPLEALFTEPAPFISLRTLKLEIRVNGDASDDHAIYCLRGLEWGRLESLLLAYSTLETVEIVCLRPRCCSREDKRNAVAGDRDCDAGEANSESAGQEGGGVEKTERRRRHGEIERFLQGCMPTLEQRIEVVAIVSATL